MEEGATGGVEGVDAMEGVKGARELEWPGASCGVDDEAAGEESVRASGLEAAEV